MKRNKSNIIILSSIIIIFILLIIFGYFFILKPALNGFAVLGFNKGVASVANYLGEQAKSCQPIPLKSGDQTINLIAIECLQKP